MPNAWISRAKAAIWGREDDGDEYYGYDDEEDGAMKLGMKLPVLIGPGEMECVRVKPGSTVNDLLRSLSTKQNYGIILVKQDIFNRTCLDAFFGAYRIGVMGRFILEGSVRIEDLAGVNWSAKRASDCNIWLVDLSAEVTVFFNTYFRMATGTPNHLQRLYPSPGMTVAEFEDMIKESLGLKIDDMRFGLYGCNGGEVMALDGSLLLSELRENEKDPQSPAFFQFQFHPNAEADEFIGSSRASNLMMRVNRGTRKQKKCWFTLQGTTLFYRPTQQDHTWAKKIEDIDMCKVIYRGANASRTSWRFDLIPQEGPVRVFTSPLKRRVVRWVRELRGAHRSLEINEPVTMAELLTRIPADEIEPAAAMQIVGASAGLESVPFQQRRLLELAEALLNKVEMNGGVLLLNGMQRPDEQLGRKWVESVRELLHHCLKCQPTATAWKVVSSVKEVLKRLKDWVKYFEDVAASRDMSPIPAPHPESIKELSEDCAHLVATFRFYIIHLNSESDILQNAKERDTLLDVLETMQDGLAGSIFEAKKKRSFPVLRNTFRNTEEIKAAKREEKERVEAEARAIKAREQRRKERSKAGHNAVWTLVQEQEAMHQERISDDEDMPEDKPQKEPGWLKSKLAKFFTPKTMRRSRFQIDYEDGEMPDDASFNMSMENGERLSEARWSETAAMLRQYSKKKGGEENNEMVKQSETSVPRTPLKQTYVPLEGMPDSPIIKSGFNAFGLKSAAVGPARGSVWRIPDTATGAAHLSDSADGSSPTMASDDLPAVAGPVRTSPEEEAMLLRMLKDPRVKGLLEEIKQQERDRTAMPIQDQAIASWSRRR